VRPAALKKSQEIGSVRCQGDVQQLAFRCGIGAGFARLKSRFPVLLGTKTPPFVPYFDFPDSGNADLG